MTMRKKIETLLTMAGISGCCAATACRSYSKMAARRALSRKTVLITGGSRGLGLALAEEFAKAGARVFLTARDAGELQRAADLLTSRGIVKQEDIASFACDVTDEQQVRELLNAASEHFQRVDVLVNCAGVITVGPVENQSIAAFKLAMETNFYGMLHTSLAVLPQMLARRSGAIVNIASIGGKIAVPHMLPYTASKFAAVGFSQGLHAELRSKGVRVTTVCPGLMRTGSHVQAQFVGNREAEYRWFSMAASLPIVSVSARFAARRIVKATRRGEAELAITPQAILAARLAQVLPEFTLAGLVCANLLLPRASSEANAADMKPGGDVRSKELFPLTWMGKEAGARLNQAGVNP